jgi:hypothetical protein
VNVVPFGPRLVPDESGAVDVPGAAARENLFRLDVIEAARTLEKAAEAGLVSEKAAGHSGNVQILLLQEVVNAADLAGLQYLDERGRLIGTIAGVERGAGNGVPLDLAVRLMSGEAVPMVEFILTLRHEGGFLRLPDTDETGLTATLEALRDRLGDGIPF